MCHNEVELSYLYRRVSCVCVMGSRELNHCLFPHTLVGLYKTRIATNDIISLNLDDAPWP